MEYLAPFGVVGFMIAARLYTEVKTLKNQIAQLDQRLTQLETTKGD